MKTKQLWIIAWWALGLAAAQAGEWMIDVVNDSNLEEDLVVTINGEEVGQPLSPGTSSGLLGIGKGSANLVVKAGESGEWSWDLKVQDGKPLVVVLRDKPPAADALEGKRELGMEKFEFHKGGEVPPLMVYSLLSEGHQFSLTSGGKPLDLTPGKLTLLAVARGSSVTMKLGEETLDVFDIEEEGNFFLYIHVQEDDNLRMFQWHVQGNVVKLKN